MALQLDPWGFCVYWQKQKGAKLREVSELQKILNRELFQRHNRPWRVSLHQYMNEPLLDSLWPDLFAFFGRTMDEATLKMEELKPILSRFNCSSGGPHVNIQLPNGMSGWMKKSFSPNEWDEKQGQYISAFQHNQNRLASFSTLDLESVVQSWKQPIMGNRWNFNAFIRPRL